MAPNEAKTRKELIDPALKRAGWNLHDTNKVRFEIPVDGFDPQAWQVLQAELQKIKEQHHIYEGTLPKGICDYALYRPNGEIIAVVEAKRTSIDPRLAEPQTRFYLTEIAKRQSFCPFGFMTNGQDIYFYDMGHASKRQVQGFFSPDDLENLLYLRQNARPLTQVRIDNTITDRSYQHEAIRRVCEAFEQGKRKTLLVMATGTGKTRTAMSIVDLFLRSNQARRILFVADRDALVQQAITDGFEAYIPHEPCARIHTWDSEKVKTSRLFAVTLQTLSNCFPNFTSGFFDLIIFDEVHRSIFNKWNDVLQYFDARMIGLTATPADFIERNTFLEFECYGGHPTYLYSYEQAVEDGYLVDYSVYAAKTKFQRKGIRGVDLSEEERNSLIEQGLDPDALDFSGTDLEKKVSNSDTLRKQWQELMEVCYKDTSGQLPGKTIVFAMTQDHALRIEEAFNQLYPQHTGLVQVITFKSEYKGTLIEAFKQQTLPRIAISVDMLETGVDVPEVVNLAFMKPVQSYIKLHQMIGRGTRAHATCKHTDWLPNGHKQEFQVIDFWENAFEKDPKEAPEQSLPVLVTLFNTRLKLLELFLGDQQSAEAKRAIIDLRAMIDRIPTDSYTVKRLYAEIEEAWQDSFWLYLTLAKLGLLRLKVGPLLRLIAGVDVEKETFTSKVERLKLQILTHSDPTATAESITEDVSRLPAFCYEGPEHKQSAQLCLTPHLKTATPSQLDQVIDTLADQMRHRRDRENTFIILDLPDYVELRGYILLQGGSNPVYVDAYREMVMQRILDLIDTDPTLDAISQGIPVSDTQLLELERTLRQTLASGGLELSEENIRKAYGFRVGSLMEFVRKVLELDGIPDYAEIVRRQFQTYISSHIFTADQIAFLRAVQNAFLQKRRLALADLYDPPLTAFGDNAVERWFSDTQVEEMLSFVASLTVK